MVDGEVARERATAEKAAPLIRRERFPRKLGERGLPKE